MAAEDIFELSTLDGNNGFSTAGITVAQSQYALSVASAGDMNGDGFDDFIVGFAGIDDGITNPNKGAAFVVFGKAGGFDPTLNLTQLNGDNGFRLLGAVAFDFAGSAVSSAGDVNGDGFDDIMVGAPGFNVGMLHPGATYVIYGKEDGFASTISLSSLGSSDGFRIRGFGIEDLSGGAVSSAGDVNGDGYDDMIMGVNTADRIGTSSGMSYVVFGKAPDQAPISNYSALDGTNGFSITGLAAFDELGISVSGAGDFNGDGFDDVIIGAQGVNASTGTAYLVFGKESGFDADLDPSTLDGTNGVAFAGLAAGNRAGRAVAGAGDINGDGMSDIVIDAPRAAVDFGVAYVVFGTDAALGASFDLGDLDGSNGFTITGAAFGDQLGAVASAGDFNGDGIDDLVLGAKLADPSGANSGAAYLIYGRTGAFAPNIDLASLASEDGFQINGTASGNGTGVTVASAGDIDNDGFDDLIIGTDKSGSATGPSYVIFGHAGTPSAKDDDFATSDTAALSGNLFDDNGHRADGPGSVAISTVNGNAANLGTEITLASGAHMTVNADGTFEYNADGSVDYLLPGMTLTDSFTYTLATGDSATVTIHVAGADGDDFYDGTAGGDAFNAGIGADFLKGGAGDDVLGGGIGNDRLNGNDGNDTLHGDDGDDILIAGKDVDQVFGDAGDDFFQIANRLRADDRVDGGSGYDRLSLNGDYSFRLRFLDSTMTGIEEIKVRDGYSYNLKLDDGNVGAAQTLVVSAQGLGAAYSLTLDGSQETDGRFTLIGGAGNDSLTGGANGDTLRGGSGNDALAGGGGVDELVGGAGSDSFVYGAVGDSSGLAGDRVGDFDADNDMIDTWFAVTGVDGPQTVANIGDLETAFDADHLGAHHAAIATATKHTYLVIDANGVAGYQAGGDLIIRVDGMTGTLDTGDFV